MHPQPAPLVIIGAGLAGWTTLREFRKRDASTPVVLVTADSGDFYAKPSLSNALAQKRSPQQLVTTPAAQMAQTLNVTLLPFCTVTQIDTATRQLTLRSEQGGQALAFERLVLATGAQVIRAPMQGNAVEEVHSVNSLTDFARFHTRLMGVGVEAATDAAATRRTVLIIGAGLIGCEFANDLLSAGYAVHVVDPAPRPMAALLPESAGLQLQSALQELGAVWHLGTTVQAVHRADATGLQATLADGSLIPADVVLSAIGLRPDMALAQAAGLQCGRGIVVNTLLETSAPGIYALGDAAEYASAGQRTLPYVMPIMQAAKCLAATLAGQPTALRFPLMPVAIKTPALPVVVSAAHPALQGSWVADTAQPQGVWRFLDSQGVQHGFVLTGKHTTRRLELGQETQLAAA